MHLKKTNSIFKCLVSHLLLIFLKTICSLSRSPKIAHLFNRFPISYNFQCIHFKSYLFINTYFQPGIISKKV